MVESNLEIVSYRDGYAIKYHGFVKRYDQDPVEIYFVDKYHKFNYMLTSLSYIPTKDKADKLFENVKINLQYYLDRPLEFIDDVLEVSCFDVSMMEGRIDRLIDPEWMLKRLLGKRIVEKSYKWFYVDNLPFIIYENYLMIFNPIDDEEMEKILERFGYTSKHNQIFKQVVEIHGEDVYFHGINQLTLKDLDFLKLYPFKTMRDRCGMGISETLLDGDRSDTFAD